MKTDSAEEFRCTCGGVVIFWRRKQDGPLRFIAHGNQWGRAELGRKDIKRLFGTDEIIVLGREPSYLHPALVHWLGAQHARD